MNDIITVSNVAAVREALDCGNVVAREALKETKGDIAGAIKLITLRVVTGIDKIESTPEAWETGKLGRDEKFAKKADFIGSPFNNLPNVVREGERETCLFTDFMDSDKWNDPLCLSCPCPKCTPR